MKLKRIISALIVFTMVMTCAVCVSADGATYQTSTKYNVSTGEITVNAKLKGATEGSMVSYIIYGDDDAENNDNEPVAEGNIVHIDQATVGADGTASFDAVTADFDAFKNRKVQFVSNTDTDDLAAGVEGKVKESNKGYPMGTNLARSVETITDMQTSVMFVGEQINQKKPTIYAMIDGVPTCIGEYSGNIGTGANWGGADGVPNYLPTKDKYKTVDLKGTTAIMVDLGTKEGRDTYNLVKFVKYGGSYNGAVNGEKASNVDSEIVYQTSSAKTVKTQDKGNVNMLVGGLYKDDITDGEFAGLELDGGDIIGVYYTNDPGNTNASFKKNANTVSYGTVYEPIIGKYTDKSGEGEFDSVTFLTSVDNPSAYEEYGLNVYRYKKATTSAAEEATLELIASLPSAADGSAKYGVQLFDGSNNGELDPTKYGFEAFPYVVIDGEKIELSVFGDTYVGPATIEGTSYGVAYYYVRNREAVTEAE